jgi:opacity protein-like surface antigen
MREFLLVIAVALAAAAAAADHAEAAAYCAYAGGRAGYENCGYYTWEQCLLAVNGRGGQCMRNPHDPALWGPPFHRNYQRARPRR